MHAHSQNRLHEKYVLNGYTCNNIINIVSYFVTIMVS
jgi:hypothetical protein